MLYSQFEPINQSHLNSYMIGSNGYLTQKDHFFLDREIGRCISSYCNPSSQHALSLSVGGGECRGYRGVTKSTIEARSTVLRQKSFPFMVLGAKDLIRSRPAPGPVQKAAPITESTPRIRPSISSQSIRACSRPQSTHTAYH